MKIGNVWVLFILEDLFFLLISSFLSWYCSVPFLFSSADVALPFPSAEGQSFSLSFLIPPCTVLVFFCRWVVLFCFFSTRVENWIENHSSGVSGQLCFLTSPSMFQALPWLPSWSICWKKISCSMSCLALGFPWAEGPLTSSVSPVV